MPILEGSRLPRQIHTATLNRQQCQQTARKNKSTLHRIHQISCTNLTVVVYVFHSMTMFEASVSLGFQPPRCPTLFGPGWLYIPLDPMNIPENHQSCWQHHGFIQQDSEIPGIFIEFIQQRKISKIMGYPSIPRAPPCCVPPFKSPGGSRETSSSPPRRSPRRRRRCRRSSDAPGPAIAR